MSVAKRRRLSEKSASPVIQPPKNYLPVHLQFFASMADFRKQEEKAAQSIKRDQKKQTIVSKPVPGSKNSWADLRKKEEAFEKAQKEKQKKQNNKSASASKNSWADLRKLDEQSMKAFQKNQKSTQQKQKTKPASASKNSWADLRRLDEQFMKAFEKIQKNQKGKVTTDARKIQNNLTLQEQINKMKQSMKVQGILSKEELYKFPFPQPKVDPKTTAYYKNLQVDKKTQKATKAINSALLDATPIIGSLKAVKELVTGRDAVTGDKTSRLEAALGIFGGGFIRGATKATKAAKAAEEVSEVSKITKGTPKATQGTGKSVKQGEFSVTNWDGYPNNGPKPEGPFRLLEGKEYEDARKAANKANQAIHKADPSLKGKQIHEIHPVKFGGSPTDKANKIPLTPKEHAQYTKYWNNLMRKIQKKP